MPTVERPTQPYYAIARAARLVGVSPATLRAWEREGLVSPVRTAAGYRRFALADIELLRQVQRLREVEKLNLPGIRRTLGIPSSGSADNNGALNGRNLGWSDPLKKLRQKRRLSLRQASALTNLSASFISSIERGLANPSVAALQRLTAAYGTNILELTDSPTTAPDCLVRLADRRTFTAGPGVTLQQLNFGASHQMELHLFTVEAGAGTGDTYHHRGEEFIYMLEGSLDVWLDELEHYTIGPSDVMYFESTRLHRWTNPGDTPAVFLGVNTPPTF
jgi:DNA-binding transcriptional MerR regulator/quercetin dioxygenase-like cupin family protein